MPLESENIMIKPEKALAAVLDRAEAMPVVERDVNTSVLGHVTAENVRADGHYPSFDRALMDGFAVCVSDAGHTVSIIGEAAAGSMFRGSIKKGTCVEIMTGAPCPEGTGAVVMLEDTNRDGKNVVLPRDIPMGANFTPMGSEAEKDQVVVADGTRISPLTLAALALLGRKSVKVFDYPSMAVITTGNEVLVKEEEPRGPFIRNSNGPMLLAMAHEIGIQDVAHFHCRDNAESLAETFEKAGDRDITVTTGGVSAGKYDLVPGAMERFGATPVFHKVGQKPGKPLFFAAKGRRLFFGLPGTPLGTHQNFHRYVSAAVRKMTGLDSRRPVHTGRLSEPVQLKGGRFKYLLARVESDGEEFLVKPLFRGSSNLCAVPDANAYILTGGGGHRLEAGEEVQFEWTGAW